MLLSVTRWCRYTPVTVMHISVHKKIMCLLKILNYDIHSTTERLDWAFLSTIYQQGSWSPPEKRTQCWIMWKRSAELKQLLFKNTFQYLYGGFCFNLGIHQSVYTISKLLCSCLACTAEILPLFTQYALFYLQPPSKSQETDIFHVESIMWQSAIFTSTSKNIYKT